MLARWIGIVDRLGLQLARSRAVCVALVALVSSVAFVRPAAAADSERGAAYVQAQLVGVMLGIASGTAATGTGFAMEIHGGYHLSGRHDGFVLGASQKLAFGGGPAGATVGRLGYDIAVPLGRRELTIAPYGFGGVFYAFSGGDPGGHFGLGVEARVFPFETLEDEARAPVVQPPKRVVVAANRIEIREKIQFKLNEAVIESVSDSLLAEVASVIKSNPQIRKLRIEGHASADGDAAVNAKLSDARAQSVRDHLIQRGGVPAEILESKGYGTEKPIASNDTEEGREKNRRVEFNIVEQSATVEKLEDGGVTRRSTAGEGLFVVAKAFELGFITTDPLITTLTFQLGAGYAF